MSTKIGHFDILSELGKSGTSTVYKANDATTNQTVALKAILLSAFGERADELEKCLVEEAEASKALSHPNLIPVHGAGKIDGQFFAAMEYIQGNSIATMLARKEGFSIWDLLDIGRQVCSGLDHAQSHNVFHFSLEPAKIMCGWDGTVRILGYGVSSVGKFADKMQGVPSLLHYMSPEQVRGESVDARSNLFSLGAIFYEMATDRQAFDGEDAEFLRRSILEGVPVAPVLINPKLHPGLSDLILKALAKDPASRYQSGRELLDDLEKCKDSKSQATKPPAAPAKPIAVPTATKAATPKKSAGPPAAEPVGAQTEVGLPTLEEATPTEKKTATPLVAAGAAASGGGAKTFTSLKPSGAAGVRPSANMSSATLNETPLSAGQTPKFAVDPLMAEGAPGRAARASFSEMTELPPLKEVYSTPPPPPQPTEPEAGRSGKASSSERKPEKAKLPSREVAAKAVNEVKNVPPRLIGYAVAVALALILIVALALYLRIKGLNNDGDSGGSSTGSAQASSRPAAVPAQPAHAVPADPADVPEPQLAPPPTDSDASPWVPAAEHPKGKEARKRSSSTAASARTAAAPGQIVIDSTPPGAQVQIDGKSDAAWVTPLTLSGLAAGEHSVTFSKSGYATDTRTVTVASGGKVSVTSHLTQFAATLAVSSNPAGANIFIDGRSTGKLTPAQVTVDKGQHVVLVRKSGFIDETTNAQFVLGQTVNFSPELRPLGNVDDIRTVGKIKKLFGGKESQGMATVAIRTQPRGAQIAVNQHMLEKDSPIDIMLDPGNYIVDITLSGYAPIHKVITVERGGKSTIEETLLPQ